MGLIEIQTVPLSVDLLIFCTGCLIIFFRIEIFRVVAFVSGLVIFSANATTLALDASINSSAAHFVSAPAAQFYFE